MSSRTTRGNEATLAAPRRANRACETVGVLAATAAAVGLLAAPASASADPRTEQPLAGVSVTCGDHVLTFTGGVQSGDLHRVRLGNGDQIVINDVVLHDTTLTDEDGNHYRAVGSANSTAHEDSDGDPEGVFGHFNVNITVLGDDGRVGRLSLRERISIDGTSSSISGGGCSF